MWSELEPRRRRANKKNFLLFAFGFEILYRAFTADWSEWKICYSIKILMRISFYAWEREKRCARVWRVHDEYRAFVEFPKKKKKRNSLEYLEVNRNFVFSASEQANRPDLIIITNENEFMSVPRARARFAFDNCLGSNYTPTIRQKKLEFSMRAYSVYPGLTSLQIEKRNALTLETTHCRSIIASDQMLKLNLLLLLWIFIEATRRSAPRQRKMAKS